MLVVIKSAPGTPGAKHALKLARELAADIVLVEDGVYLAGQDMLGGFCGTAHALQEDLDQREVGPLEKGVRPVSRDELKSLMDQDEIVGTY